MRAFPTFALLASLWLTSSAVAADKKPPVTPTGWTLIGMTHAKHTNDKDSIAVYAPHNKFRQLKVGVVDASLHMQQMVVIYANGSPENVPIRYVIQKDNQSQALTLEGAGRPIRQVDFKYDTKGWLHGSADVYLYGR